MKVGVKKSWGGGNGIPFKSKYKGNPFIFICAERQTDRQTNTQTDRQRYRQTDKHPQPCSENKPFGILRRIVSRQLYVGSYYRAAQRCRVMGKSGLKQSFLSENSQIVDRVARPPPQHTDELPHQTL